MDGLGNPLGFLLTGGERHDVSQAPTLLRESLADRSILGHPIYVIADRAYEHVLEPSKVGGQARAMVVTGSIERAIREAERTLAETIRTVPPADDVEFRTLAAGLRRIAARKALLGNPRFAVDPEDAA